MTEFDRIPKEVFLEAEKFGVLEKDILFAAHADKNPAGVFCDNWMLITEEEIIMVGGIQLVTHKEGAKWNSRQKLEVKYSNISVDRLSRDNLKDFKTEKQISGCIMTAFNKETENYSLITYLTCRYEEDFQELCRLLNADGEEDKPADGEVVQDAGGMLCGHGGPPPHGHGGPPPHGHGGHGGRRKKDEDYCPKCGRRYPDAHNKLCPHCMNKASVIKRLFSFVKKYMFSVILILLAMVMVSVIGVISPYVSSGFFYDQVLTAGGKFYGEVLLVIMIIVSLKVLSLLVDMVNNIITARIVPKLVYDMKKTIFDAVEKLSLGFFTNRRTGALMNQVNGDANTIYWFFVEGLPYLIVNVIQTVAVGILMFFIDWRLSLVALVFCPLCFWLIKLLSRKMKMFHAKRYSAQRAMTGQLSDVLSGVRVVKAFSREKEEIDRFNKRSEYLADTDRTMAIFAGTAFPGVTFLFTVASVLVLGVGGWLVISGEMTYGTLMTFTAYSAMLISPLMFFVNITQSITNCFNATYRLMEVMDAEPEVFEKDDAKTIDDFKGAVRFEGVTFGYDKTRKVIEDVTMDIPAGGKIGIVGHTGAGKSTIANLLIRLYDTDMGRITIDGIDVRDLTFDTLRSNIAIVSQETYLFQGTILDNIRYAKPDATMDEIITASKISGAHDFIIKLPDGYSTRLGWGYKELSGGERQRVSIARAILRDPKILILDEATSAMDTKTERSIQQALEKLTENRTTIMIAHRLSTLRDCEKLFVIEHGRVAEEGTHLELIHKKGIYFKLYTLQYQALKNAGVGE
ncbi:MAG: ABC transporter ATP-binding protein [Ruminococcaceae bacterium]|nr:ABC transporter ATP-binding protein [Oscillospiraceae bacterium]